MSWGKDPSKWGKPITVRFLPTQFKQLEELLAHRNSGLDPWQQYRAWSKSSLIIDLIAQAHSGLKLAKAASADTSRPTRAIARRKTRRSPARKTGKTSRPKAKRSSGKKK